MSTFSVDGHLLIDSPSARYDWKSDAVMPGCTDSGCGEHMGLINHGGRPLPSWHAVHTLHSFIGGMQFLGKVGVCHTDPCLVMDDDFALTFRNSSHMLIAAWSIDGFRHSASLKFARGCWQQYDWLGESLGEKCPHGDLDRRLSMDETVPERYVNVYVEDSPTYLVQPL